MSTHVPRGGLIVLLLCAAFSGVAFWVLNGAFGGPSPVGSGPSYELVADVPDSQQLLVKSLVMVRGVKVGEVTDVEGGADGTRVRFSVDRPVRRGATVQVGSRTAFGEAYLRLDRGAAGGARLAAGARVRVKPSVEADEALATFGPATREHLRSLLRTTAASVRDADADDRLRAAIQGGGDAIAGLRDLTATLRGQEGDLAALVTDGGTLTQALAARDGTLRAIVRDGAATLRALAARRASLRAALDEVAPTTRAARATLDAVPGLLADAGPVVRDAGAAAAALRPALRRLPATATAASAVVSRLPRTADAVVPAAREAAPVITSLKPVGEVLEPTLRNMIPLARWLGPRAKSYATVLANVASATDHGDADGKWLRLFMFPDLQGTLGLPVSKCADGGQRRTGGGCSNAYPAPGDAEHNQPYADGDYPRLLPYPKPKT